MNGPEYLRIGDAERDQMTTALHEHFAQGRLTSEELEERLDATLSAKTVGELRAVSRDLPDSQVMPTADAAAVRRFRPRVGLLLLFVAAMVALTSLAGPWWAPLVVLRVLFTVALIRMFVGFRRGRRFHRHHGMYGRGPVPHWQRPYSHE
jgi:Flp pilus assembly protein TadB